MKEPIPGENSMGNPIEEAARPARSEGGNKRQWEQELDGEASLSRIERGDKHLVVIAAEFFSKKAAQYFQDISQEITNPEEWYFLVEGKDAGIYECEIAKGIAKEKNVPIEDPIFDPFQKEVIELYLASSRREKMPREIIIGQLAAKIANARGTSDLEEVATVLGATSSQELELYKNIALAVAKKSEDPKGYATWSKQMFNDLIEISKIVSAQVLDYYLRQNPTRNHVVLYVGESHKGIVMMDRSGIPDDLKFNDEQIQDLLNKRRKTRLQQIFRSFGIETGVTIEVFPELKPTTIKPEQERGQESSRKTRLAEVLNEIPDIPENLKTIIEKWADNLFGLRYVRERGYQEYLDSDNSLHQIWGAAALLAERVDAAKAENRELRPEEISEIKKAFLKAANSRRKNPDYASEGNEIKVMSKNIDTLIEIAKRLG